MGIIQDGPCGANVITGSLKERQESRGSAMQCGETGDGKGDVMWDHEPRDAGSL